MSQQTVAILALIALLLPTGGAILARLIGRRFGNRATQIVGALSFAIALGSAVALYGAEIDRVALGPLAVFVPARGPLIESEAFSLRRAAIDAPTAVEVAELAPSVEAPTPAQPQTSTAPSPTTASTTSATTMPAASATTRPTDIATASPTPTTALVTPTARLAVQPTATPTVRPAVQPTVRTPNRPATEPRAYFVEEGDTLRSIAERFDLSIEALLRYNGLSRAEGDQLQVGQKLFIPPVPAARAAGPAVEPTERPTVRPTPRPTARPASRPATEPRAYFVEEGDTLRSIAERFDLSIEALLRYNGLSRTEGDQLQVGQKLFIPPR